MAQKPSKAAATIAGVQDYVAGEVHGADAFTDLSSTIQTNMTTIANEAFYEVTSRAQWFALVNPSVTDLPSEWNELFRATWVAKAMRFYRGAQAGHAYYTSNVEPLNQRIADHYTANWLTDSILATDSFTLQKIRQSVIARLVRQRTPFTPTIQEIDNTIREEFYKLWMAGQWNFRKRQVEVTLKTDGSIEIGGNHEFSGLASQSFVIKDSNGRSTVEWVDSQRMAEIMAFYWDTSTSAYATGRPKFFFDVDQGDDKTVQLLPKPDVAYTAFAVVLIGPPAFGTSATASDGFSSLPAAFRAHLRDWCVAIMLSQGGREDTDALRLLAHAQQERTYLLGRYEDKGQSRTKVHNFLQRNWVRGLPSARGTNVLGTG